MQPMGDGLAVLGSRHGMLWDPFNRLCYLVRFDRHPGIPFTLRVGLRLPGRTVVLPLAPEGATFGFLDQKLTPTTMVLTGIDPVTGLKVRLQVRIPFRPQDADFSTTPVYYLTATVSRLEKAFRWVRPQEGSAAGTLFVEIAGQGLKLSPREGGLDLALEAPVTGPVAGRMPVGAEAVPTPVKVKERVEVLGGTPTATGAEVAFDLEAGEAGELITLAWCAWAPPILSLFGERAPFRYHQRFASLADVVAWARRHAEEVESAGRWFDEVSADHSLGSTVTHLMGQTLHAWLINTWWAVRPATGRDWFSVWEGSCHFHSTVDVEFTQAPFYLTLWPELLRMQLDEWPEFSKPGDGLLGERGEDTLFLSHDMGVLAACGAQAYPHDMEVEEATDYVLMAYAYWRRTADRSIHTAHAATIRRYLDFCLACDTSGNGVPDEGCTNTIDDASPAIQYAREQVYLAVKTLGALECGADMLSDAGYTSLQVYRQQAERIRRAIETRGWLGDHYSVTLTPSAEGLHDPWTGEPLHGDLPGWDAYHIYTANALPILDMVGRDLGLDDGRLAEDALNAAQHCLTRYGCRHSSYGAESRTALTEEGVAVTSNTIGWVSMNMLRDIAAAYRGVDLLVMAERYWDWQATTNARDVRLFFETFGGNNLCFYPRGVAVWGYLEAAAGLVYDRVTGEQGVNALRITTRVPLLALADWRRRQVPVFES
ncbi:MAG: glutaminase domain-containing protein [Anaerolineae bacterium]